MKKLAIAAITVATCATVGLLAACDSCNGDKKGSDADISLMNSWRGNENEETYSIRTETNGDLTVKYEKSGEWQYASRTFLEEEANLALMKTLVLEGSMVTNTNDPMVTLKITYKGDIPEKEVHFTMSETKATYEWDLSNAQLDQALTLMLFAEGNRVSASGTITFNDIHLTASAINQANNIEANKPSEEKVVNEITATNKTVNGGWYDAGDNVYTVTKSGNDYSVAYNKKSSSYAMLNAYVKGAAIGDMKSFKITVQGTEGETILVKPFDKVEASYTLTGGEDDIYVDISAVADVDFTAEQKIIIFIQPNVMDVTGSFTIKNAEFSTEEAPKAPVDDKVLNTITSANRVVKGWYDNGGNAYTVTANDDGTVNVTKKAGGSWSTLRADVTGAELANIASFKITLSGVEGKNIIVKPYDKVESKLEPAADDEVTITVDLTQISDVDYSNTLPILIFYDWDNEADVSFTIKSAEFVYKVNEITDTETTVSGWYDNGGNAYTVTANDDGTVDVTKKAGGSWSTLRVDVTGAELANMASFKITLSGVEGKNVIVKPYDKVESKLEPATDDEVTITVDLTQISDVDYSATLPILIFYEWDNDTDVSFKIVSAEFVAAE